MITITVANDGRVMRIGYQDKVLPKGAIEVDAIPTEPTVDETEVAVLYYLDGELVWKVEDAPPMPEPEPQPEPEPPNPSEMRRQAYQLEVDEKSISYVGYKADAVKARKDGNDELAEQYEAIADSILEQIGKKKAEIRERYPDEATQ